MRGGIFCEGAAVNAGMPSSPFASARCHGRRIAQETNYGIRM